MPPIPHPMLPREKVSETGRCERPGVHMHERQEQGSSERGKKKGLRNTGTLAATAVLFTGIHKDVLTR